MNTFDPVCFILGVSATPPWFQMFSYFNPFCYKLLWHQCLSAAESSEGRPALLPIIFSSNSKLEQDHADLGVTGHLDAWTWGRWSLWGRTTSAYKVVSFKPVTGKYAAEVTVTLVQPKKCKIPNMQDSMVIKGEMQNAESSIFSLMFSYLFFHMIFENKISVFSTISAV